MLLQKEFVLLCHLHLSLTHALAGTGRMCVQSAAFVFCHVRGHYIAPASLSTAPPGDKILFFDSRAAAAGGGGVPVQILLSDAGKVLKTCVLYRLTD
jgi:hypothetical protein